MVNSNYLINFILFISIILGITLRLLNINYDNLWIDEMATFWVTDPSINFSEMIERHRATELAPQFYYVIIYLLHKIFVYDPSVGRYFSSFIGILSIFSIGYLIKIIAKNNAYKLGIFLISFNVFLISYSMEMRTYMLMFFISTLSLITIFKYLEIKKNYLLLLFFITQICLILTHPFSLIIFASISILPIYQYIFKHPVDKNFIITLAITGISILMITYLHYSNLKIGSDYLWNKQPSLKFYTNFYFSQYFGSRLLGAIHLLLILFLIFRLRNFLFKNYYLIILLTLLILSYFVPLMYGLYKPIITSKYIIFVLIPITILLSVLIYEIKNKIIKNFLISFIILITLANQFTEQNFKQFFEDRRYFKPQYNLALKYINESDNKNYFVDLNFAKTENLKKNYLLIYKNYLNFISKQSKYNQLKYISNNEINNKYKELWILCSYLVYGENCKKSISGQTILEEKQFKNLYLTLVKVD